MDGKGYYILNFLFLLKGKKKEPNQTKGVCGCLFPLQTKIICTTVMKNIIQARHIIHKLEMTLFLSTVGRAGFHLHSFL